MTMILILESLTTSLFVILRHEGTNSLLTLVLMTSKRASWSTTTKLRQAVNRVIYGKSFQYKRFDCKTKYVR